MNAINERYIELMKNVLTDFHRMEMGEYLPINKITLSKKYKLPLLLDNFLQKRGWALCKVVKYNKENRLNGRDWPSNADTMVGIKRLENVKYCVSEVINNKIDGDFIETGVWRGGTTIFMKALLKAMNNEDKIVWVADSFEGLPKPNEEKYKLDKGDIHHTKKELAIPLEVVKYNFEKYNLLDDKVKFLKGWFKDTLPLAPINKLSILRLDGDLYESTMDSLVNLYPKLSIGGFIIIDDWVLDPCRQAVQDYRTKHGITEEVIAIDGTGAFWKREK